MKLQDLLNSRIISGLAIFLSRVVPEKVGYGLADRIARTIASFRNSAPVQAVRANQWMISQKHLSGEELDQRVLSIFRFTGYALYDYYHNLTRPDKVRQKVIFSERLRSYFPRLKESKEGLLILLPHLGNFDLAGMALALQGLPFLVLSYPRPPGGYRLQNMVRQLTGVETLPMSVTNLRKATERLRSGGAVMTGMDRPLAEGNYAPRFFGAPARLPVAYVGMAKKANVPVVVAGVFKQPDGRYFVDASELITMDDYPDRQIEVEKNAEKVLKRAEEFIARAPQQWVMYYPVWPEAIRAMPG